MGNGERTRARMRNCSRSTLLALSPRAHSLARALMEAGSYGTPEAAHARARAWAFLSLPQFRRPPGRTCGNTPRGKSLERAPGSARARKQALGLLPSGNRDKHVCGPRSPGRQLLWPHAYLN
jgi:hypothetical protein